jgi:hypothetical protein
MTSFPFLAAGGALAESAFDSGDDGLSRRREDPPGVPGPDREEPSCRITGLNREGA